MISMFSRSIYSCEIFLGAKGYLKISIRTITENYLKSLEDSSNV